MATGDVGESLQILGVAFAIARPEQTSSRFYVPCLDTAIGTTARGILPHSVLQLIGVAISDFALRGGIVR